MNTPRVLIPQRIGTGIARGAIRQLDGTCMGTSWSVRFADEGRASEDLTGLIAALLERIENQMSHFRAHSELCRFATLPVGESLALSPEFARVLSAALDVARLSDGAFDPTVAPLVDAWGFGASLRYTDSGFVPPSAAIIRPSAAGWQQVDLDADNRLRQTGNVALNLAAIAKGFAVDAVSELLTQSGWPHHLVEIGGELRGAGLKPDGQPWWVALELPAADCPLTATRIALHGLSVATSGDYRRSYQISARRLQHTLDPRSGAPVAHRLASVTVIHPECMLADAWATAIMVLGLGDGLALAEKMNLCVLLQGRDAAGQWVEASSAGWQAMLQS